MKVAQVGRRLAEYCLDNQPELSERYGLDAEVVEAACLGHDLGHPPFGHIGEATLNRLLLGQSNSGGEPLDKDGFEGNAQSFRIVTHLAVRFPECGGLDLTRATLAALLKYPWPRKYDGPERQKWGYYRTEQVEFDFCMEDQPDSSRTLEAELMDWADDIAYSVHDLEDFHRCNYIPWARIMGDRAPDLERVVKAAEDKWHDRPSDSGARLREAHRRLSSFFTGYQVAIMGGAYAGTREQRLAIRTLTSELIGRFIRGTRLSNDLDASRGSKLDLDPYYEDEVRLLKQVAKDYIISSPALAAQQRGQQRILKELFFDFLDELERGEPAILPMRYHHILDEDDFTPARAAADCVASLTEGEAIALHRRLSGAASGSVLDPIVR
jgi:dGTPase